MITLEMHKFNNYSTASQHFLVLQAHFFNSFDNNAHDSKSHSHKITACRHDGLPHVLFVTSDYDNLIFFCYVQFPVSCQLYMCLFHDVFCVLYILSGKS